METNSTGITPVMPVGNDSFGGSSWLWIIILLFFFWGGNNNNSDVARESTMNTQFMERDLQNINTNILTSANALGNQIQDNKYNASLGFANIEKDILLGNQTLASSMSSCCCDLRTAIHAEGEATRALIQENTIQDLRDKVADRDREALATGLSYSTSLSVRNAKDEILNSLGNYYPKTGVNPYYVYGYSTGTQII